MSDSEAYVRAAKDIHDGKWQFACTALGDYKLCERLSSYFCGDGPLGYAYLSVYDRLRLTPKQQRESQEFRVLALCLMAAIADSEDKERK